MTTEKIIRTALSSIGLPVAKGTYDGKAAEYIYFLMIDSGAAEHGDDDVTAYSDDVRICYVAPRTVDHTEKKKQIWQSLKDAGIECRSFELAEEDNGQRVFRIVFEGRCTNFDYLEV